MLVRLGRLGSHPNRRRKSHREVAKGGSSRTATDLSLHQKSRSYTPFYLVYVHLKAVQANRENPSKELNLDLEGYGANLQGCVAWRVETEQGLDVGRGVRGGRMVGVEGHALQVSEEVAIKRLGTVGTDEGRWVGCGCPPVVCEEACWR